jgi:hypothetical protein
LSFYEGVRVGVLKIEESESALEDLKIEESESELELLCTNSTALLNTLPSFLLISRIPATVAGEGEGGGGYTCCLR